MSIQIFNSLSKKKEPFPPANQHKTIKMYTCGVTVYDLSHIGHARSLFVFDVIRNYFQYRGYEVKLVRNITDVDDKIINRAKESNKTFEEVVEENIAAYKRDLKNLHVKEADCEPRATENIPDMVKDIQGLQERGFAYEVDGDVYYNVRKFKDYGKLSKQSLEKMQEAVRIEPDSKKKDPLDFALWKKSQEGEPTWPSPWGEGRPGWHIECSCMSLKYLKCETLDIHAGGRDLIFPHHENEIAQAESLSGKPFAKFWIHHGLLTMNGQKMAKSSGNFITIQEALQKYSVDQIKFFFLSSHYASPIDFSEKKMEEDKKALDRLSLLLKRIERFINNSKAKTSKPSGQEIDSVEKHRIKFLDAMDDDFNTPKALGSLFDLVNDTHKFIDTEQQHPDFLSIISTIESIILKFCKEIFGLALRGEESPLTDEEQKLLEERQKARERKDFEESDKIRQLLMDRGVIIEDTKVGQVWRRA